MTITPHTPQHPYGRPVRAIAAAACLAAVALTTAGPAAAAGPTSEWVTLDDTFTWDDCGFPSSSTTPAAALPRLDRRDRATVRRWVLAPDSKSSYTNPITGDSVTSGDPFVVHRYNNSDGTITVGISGLRFHLRGGGTVYVDSGRDILLFTESGRTVLSSVGPVPTSARHLAPPSGDLRRRPHRRRLDRRGRIRVQRPVPRQPPGPARVTHAEPGVVKSGRKTPGVAQLLAALGPGHSGQIRRGQYR